MTTEDKMTLMYVGITFFRYLFWVFVFVLSIHVLTEVLL